jgi:hypothetical protein
MDNVKNELAREPYEAPVIEDIPLRAEEQVLAGCKQPGGVGPQSGGGPISCSDPSCQFPGVS